MKSVSECRPAIAAGELGWTSNTCQTFSVAPSKEQNLILIPVKYVQNTELLSTVTCYSRGGNDFFELSRLRGDVKFSGLAWGHKCSHSKNLREVFQAILQQQSFFLIKFLSLSKIVFLSKFLSLSKFFIVNKLIIKGGGDCLLPNKLCTVILSDGVSTTTDPVSTSRASDSWGHCQHFPDRVVPVKGKG